MAGEEIVRWLISIFAILACSIAPTAAAEERASAISGKLTFDVPREFKLTSEPGFALYIERSAIDAPWSRCSVKVLTTPTFGLNQQNANERVRKSSFEGSVGPTNKLVRSQILDHGGIAIKAFSFETADAALVDTLQLFLIDGLFAHVVQADCVWPSGADDPNLEAGRAFLSSMRIVGH